MTLELASTQELVAELFKRFDCAIFVGIKEPQNEHVPDHRAIMWRYQGNKFICLGAASNLVHMMNAEIEQEITPISPGEL